MLERKRSMMTAIALAVAALQGWPTQASEWRYCLALSPHQHTVYMSPPFADAESMEATEAEFGRALDHALVQHESVQCPLGSMQSIAAMKQQAIQYSQASGNKVVQLNWRP